jgi:hypothetical protein
MMEMVALVGHSNLKLWSSLQNYIFSDRSYDHGCIMPFCSLHCFELAVKKNELLMFMTGCTGTV